MSEALPYLHPGAKPHKESKALLYLRPRMDVRHCRVHLTLRCMLTVTARSKLRRMCALTSTHCERNIKDGARSGPAFNKVA